MSRQSMNNSSSYHRVLKMSSVEQSIHTEESKKGLLFSGKKLIEDNNPVMRRSLSDVMKLQSNLIRVHNKRKMKRRLSSSAHTLTKSKNKNNFKIDGKKVTRNNSEMLR